MGIKLGSSFSAAGKHNPGPGQYSVTPGAGRSGSQNVIFGKDVRSNKPANGKGSENWPGPGQNQHILNVRDSADGWKFGKGERS